MSDRASYRPDIDGLRAIAVLSVFIFHLNAAWLPGGFVGVDIFFVISGFLISSHIFQAVESQSFSFKDFYRRRINRILPALYGVLLLTIIVCGFFYLPPDYRKAAQSAIEALSFKANLFFANDYDYFTPSTAQLPLLNLWSLSVEEQFYLFLPALAIFGFARIGVQKKRIAIISLIAMSVGIAEYKMSYGGTKIAYYSVLSRSSQLLVGTLLASITWRARPRMLNEVFALVGLALLALSFSMISATTRYPGAIGLLPCIGAALIIFARESHVSKFLALKPLVFIGLISYSLYLYHWPVMSIARYFRDDNAFTFQICFVVTIVSFALAVLSWRFIEKPFRTNPRGFNNVLIRGFVIPSAVGIGLLFIITGTHGLPQRYGAQAEVVTRSLTYLSPQYCHGHFDDKCKFGDVALAPHLLLLGDSTAGHYQPVFNEIGKNLGFSFVARSADACFPIVKTSGTNIDLQTSSDCLDQIAWSEKAVVPFDIVVLSGNWAGYRDMAQFSKYTGYLEASLKTLVAQGKRVVILEQIPECKGVVKFYRQNFSALHFLFDPTADYQSVMGSCGTAARDANLVMQQIAERNGSTFLKLASKFQEVATLPFSSSEYYYKDDSHLNEYGGVVMGKYLAGHMAELSLLK